VRETTQLPGAEVSRDEDHALAPVYRFLVVPKAFESNQVADIAFVQFREVTELRKKAAEIREYASENRVSLSLAEFRHCHPQVLNAGSTLSRCESISESRDGFSGGVSNRTGHILEGFQ
jgi:hypothetical protein